MPSFARELEDTLHNALGEASSRRHEYATLEHLLIALVDDPHASKVLDACAVDRDSLRQQIKTYLDNELGALVSESKSVDATPTSGFQRVVQRSILHVTNAGLDQVTGANVLVALFSERESYAVYFLQSHDISRIDAVTYLSDANSSQKGIEQPSPENEAKSLINRIFKDDLRAVPDSIPVEPVLNTPRIADKIVDLTLDVVEQAVLSSNSNQLKRPLLTIGIYGPWGSGKSTLLQCLGPKLTASGFVSVFINTWKWAEGEDVFTFVNRELLKSLSLMSGMWWRSLIVRAMLGCRLNYKRFGAWMLLAGVTVIIGYYVDWGKTVTTDTFAKGSLIALSTAAIVAIIAKPVGSFVEKMILQEPVNIDAREALSQSYRYLDFVRRMTYQYRRSPIVFLFDDLDRCSDEKVVTFIQSIHSLTSGGSVCVIACDEDFASAAIYNKYRSVADYLDEGTEFGRRFLEKIVQVPFRLPEVSSRDLVELGPMPKAFLENGPGAEAEEADTKRTDTPSMDTSPTTEAAEMSTVSEVRLSEICGSVLSLVVEPCRLQIRQIKMLFNVVKLYSMIFPPLDEVAAQRMAAFLVISYVDPHWIPVKYFGRVSSALRTDLNEVENDLRSKLGGDTAAIARLYRLFGVEFPRDLKLGESVAT